ncbi:MAG: TatD family hydrolase [Candidatus Portnoybacteria bacterium]|nr:TatD family hydrolase [Candidatus Portnoybacteria bacterium]
MAKPFLIDTHAHVNFNAYKDDGNKVIKRTFKKNIWLINVGAQYSTSQRAVEYAEKYKEGVYAAVGLHPSHIHGDNLKQDQGAQEESRKLEEFNQEKYKKLLENPKVVAMGEIGLEYGDEISQAAKDKQKEVLIEQLELAQQIGKPVMFHCRKAYDDLIELLAGFKASEGVVHCFMGRWSQAEKLLEMGFYFGFNGLITYARDYDKVIEKLPLEKILLETDCPYLTPVPHRDKRNEPLYVKYVAEKIAQIKKIKFEQVAVQTTKNARELFRI